MLEVFLAATQMMNVLLFLMLVSHVAATVPAWSALRRGSLPLAPISAVVSFLLYYDFGLVFELLGHPYQVAFFPSLFEVNPGTQRTALAILIVAPWILLAGARLSCPQLRVLPSQPTGTVMRSDRRSAFYLLATLLTVAPAAYGLSHLASGRELWYLRADVGADLGPWVILLSVPMHLLAFYATLEDAKTTSGRIFALFLAIGAICSSLICGQRSLLLIPLILMALSFFRRIRFWRALALAGACVVTAAALLPIFRGAYQDKRLRQDNLVAEIIHNDFSRASVLATSIELSPPVGSRVLSYPMSGYVYATLLFVPRQWAPYKGRSTAIQFTGYLLNQRPEWLNWGFGAGMLEELILNAGTRFCLGGVLLYGLVLGYLARLQLRQPALTIPLSLGPLFLCGYHLPSLLLNFGLMCFVCAQLARRFAEPRRLEVANSGRSPVPAVPGWALSHSARNAV